MNNYFKNLIEDIAIAEDELSKLKAELVQKRLACIHDWETRYEPIVTGEYEDPGGPEWFPGPDYCPPSTVPKQEEPRWVRECNKCGTKEETKQVREEIKKIPVF
jgi:hypothetical protein